MTPVTDKLLEEMTRKIAEMAKLWRVLSEFDVAKDILVYAFEEVERWRYSRSHVVAHALRHGRILYEKN
jgi:hypothetical protein